MSATPALRGLVIALGILCVTAQAATIHVSTAGSDAKNGQTWPNAKRTVQAGLNAAAAGDQIWVAAGTYVENVWLADDVQLYGGFAGTEADLAQRDWTANVTIVDGDQLDSVITAFHVGTAARIDGFTIRNGMGGYTKPFGYVGGGIYCNNATPTIANNSITANSATVGGGISCLGDSSPTITNNTIFANSASMGAGIYSDSTSLLVTGNTITGNNADSLGGGISLHNSSGMVAGNTITGNTSSDAGGGIYCKDATSRIADNVIAGNNAAGSDGGGICCDYSSPTITGNTITCNRASSLSGGIFCSVYASPTITNTIIAFNSSGIGIYGTPIPSVTYSCVCGNRLSNFSGMPDPTGTDGNISTDPLFVSATPGPDGLWGTADDTFADLHLVDSSPCRNTGDPAFVPTSGETDMDGQPRVMADRVDIGADEFTWMGDANLDGYVDVVDLLKLVYAFGTNTGEPGYDPACDFNNDGAIDVVDLLKLVYNFGK
jgi:parallel beta-helix repeat protein